jgi:hypothetical protein
MLSLVSEMSSPCLPRARRGPALRAVKAGEYWDPKRAACGHLDLGHRPIASHASGEREQPNNHHGRHCHRQPAAC